MMKLSFATEQSKPAGQRNAAVFWLFGIIVLYQILYQVYIGYILRHDASALDPWCTGGHSGTQQCSEAQLFRGWETADQQTLKLPEPLARNLLKHEIFKTDVPSAAPELKSSTASADAAESASTTQAPQTPHAKGLIVLQERLEEHVRTETSKKTEQQVLAAHSTITEWHNINTLGRDLQALHDHFGTRIAQRRAHTQSAKEDFSNLTSWARDIQALQEHFEAEFVPRGLLVQNRSLPSEAGNMTPWSQDLAALQQRMEVRMQAHNKAHEAIGVLDARIGFNKTHHIGAITTHAPALLDQIAALGRELCADDRHRQDPKCTQFLTASSAVPTSTAAPASQGRLRGAKAKTLNEAEAQLHKDLQQLAEKQHAWEKSFVEKVSHTMAELCSDPSHSTRPSCAQFLHDHPIHTEESDIKAKHQAWHKSFAAKIANVGHTLCSNPIRRNYRICQQIFNEKEQLTSGNLGTQLTDSEEDGESDAKGPGDIETSDPKHNLELHWSRVLQHGNETGVGMHDSAALAQVIASDVSTLRRSAHWSGRIPSVACITLVPKGSTAKAWMSYFIDNFRLQKYEGGHQLVLVYHHTDSEAAELVHKYADGTYIHAAAARGEEFPSAAALRFGAWIARDADIVARWDFNAWHHPHRLSLQVRALALSGRPASLLKRWTIVNETGANVTVDDGEYWDSSLVGEASWMRANWYPYMEEERGALEAHKRDMVFMDAPDLEVFDEAARW
jgi:hypothetical protein